MLNMIDLVLRSKKGYKKSGLKNMLSKISSICASSVHGNRHRSLDAVVKLGSSQAVSMLAHLWMVRRRPNSLRSKYEELVM